MFYARDNEIPNPAFRELSVSVKEVTHLQSEPRLNFASSKFLCSSPKLTVHQNLIFIQGMKVFTRTQTHIQSKAGREKTAQEDETMH